MADDNMADDYKIQKELEELLAKYRKAGPWHLSLNISGPIHKEGWSDEILRDWIRTHTFPDIIGNRGLSLDILKRFWSYYITGDYPECCDLNSVIGCVVLMTPDVNDKLEYKSLLTFSTAKSESDETSFAMGKIKNDLPANFRYASYLKDELKSKTDKTRQLYSPEAIRILRKEENDEYKKKNFAIYGEIEYTNFSAYINKRLKAFPVTGTFSKEDRKFLDLSTALALMCLRAFVKKRIVLEDMFFKSNLISSLKNVLLIEDDLLFAPPCETFLNKLQTDLDKQRSDIMKPLVLAVVENSGKSEQGPNNNLALLNFTCMTQTKFNGLTMIKLTLTAMKALGLEWDSLYERLNFKALHESLKLIDTFLKENLLNGSPQYSCYWCRIINDDYYSDLNPKKHSYLATVLGTITELETGSKDIWNSYWAQSHQSPQARELGKILYEELKPKKVDDPKNIPDF